MQHIPQQQIYDPWEIKQEITDFNIEIHCCRYWMLSEWECENLSLPSWRIYHSRTGGSFVRFGGETYELTNDKLILIPPYTAFSSCIHQQYKKSERIKGIKITREEEVSHYAAKGMSDQFLPILIWDILTIRFLRASTAVNSMRTGTGKCRTSKQKG